MRQQTGEGGNGGITEVELHVSSFGGGYCNINVNGSNVAGNYSPATIRASVKSGDTFDFYFSGLSPISESFRLDGNKLIAECSGDQGEPTLD